MGLGLDGTGQHREGAQDGFIEQQIAENDKQDGQPRGQPEGIYVVLSNAGEQADIGFGSSIDTQFDVQHMDPYLFQQGVDLVLYQQSISTPFIRLVNFFNLQVILVPGGRGLQHGL